MDFNDNQREGVAKVTDNLATACMVAAIVGGLVDHKVDLQIFASLLGLFTVLLSAGLNLRKQRS